MIHISLNIESYTLLTGQSSEFLSLSILTSIIILPQNSAIHQVHKDRMNVLLKEVIVFILKLTSTHPLRWLTI